MHVSVKYQSRGPRADMFGRAWGPLTAVKRGGLGFWLFRCPAGHESLIAGAVVRRAARVLEKEGKGCYAQCPVCKQEKKR